MYIYTPTKHLIYIYFIKIEIIIVKEISYLVMKALEINRFV